MKTHKNILLLNFVNMNVFTNSKSHKGCVVLLAKTGSNGTVMYLAYVIYWAGLLCSENRTIPKDYGRVKGSR